MQCVHIFSMDMHAKMHLHQLLHTPFTMQFYIARMASITLYEHAGFQGKTLELTEDAPNFVSLNFNDVTSSIRVKSGTWTLYQHVDYKGKSLTLSEGDYGIDVIKAGVGNDVISSAKCVAR